MKIRNLKIAVSAASILACVLLLALWVRSHWVCDILAWNGGRRVTVFSGYGQIRVTEWNTTSTGAPLLKWQIGSMMPDGIGPWYFQAGRQQIFLVFPHRLPIAALVLLAVAPWIRWRFSLRAVMIAVTVVSLVLGLLLYSHSVKVFGAGGERMKIRILKIAVSAVSVLACVLLIALWVRSYWIGDTIHWNRSGRVVIASRQGTLSVSSSPVQFSGVPTWQWRSTPTGSMMPEFGRRSWSLQFHKDGTFIRFPYRLPVAVFILCAIAPWIRWHFSLRALLIATAVIALLLGLLLYRW